MTAPRAEQPERLRLTDSLESLRPAYELVVIGGGINGLAVARDASARGIRTLLLERDDLGAHTTNASSRLIHGGLKYLEHMELKLVRESIRERTVLLRDAPHLVRPYPMLIPFEREGSRPGWMLSAGLMLHDALSIGKPLPRSRILSRRAVQERWPGLAAGHRGGGLYVDANVAWTERLCVEIALAAQRDGADLRTAATVTALRRRGGAVTGVEVARPDAAGGRGHVRTIDARVVVNLAGTAIDEVAGSAVPMSMPVRGSHIVVDRFPGAPETCLFFEARSDRRPMFVLPWAGRFMIGTTDLRHEGRLDDVVATDGEIDYLLAEANRIIPSAGLGRESVQWSYAGLRALPRTEADHVSRDYVVVDHGARGADAGLITVIGGKLTTHRALGESVVDLVAARLDREIGPSITAGRPLPGAPEEGVAAFRDAFVSTAPVSREQAERLVDVYGARAAEIAAAIREDPALGAVVDEGSGAVAAEVLLADREGARGLADILFRRTVIGLGPDAGRGAVAAVAAVAAQRLGWSDERVVRESEAVAAEVARMRPRSAAPASPHHEGEPR